MRDTLPFGRAGLVVLFMARAGSAAAPDPDFDGISTPPPPATRWQRPLALEGQLGFGAPLGLAGLALDVTPLPWFSINSGIGTNLTGVQFAAMPRVRVELLPVTAAFGVGVSGGKYEDVDNPNRCDGIFSDCPASFRRPIVTRRWNPAFRGNLEFDIEGRTRDGFQWRVSLGYGRILNADASTCSFLSIDERRPANCDGGAGIVYVGMALGYSFSL